MSFDVAQRPSIPFEPPQHGASKRATYKPTSRAQLRALAERISTAGQPQRRSIFKEVDVDGDDLPSPMTFDLPGEEVKEDYFTLGNTQSSPRSQGTPVVADNVDHMPLSHRSYTTTRLSLLAFAMVLLMPLLYDIPLLGKSGPSIIGAKAGVIRHDEFEGLPSRTRPWMAKRSDTSTDVCNRWSQQSALVNGTIYLFGGHASQEADQTQDTWTNDFLSLDVTSDFDISNAPLKGLPQPSDLPAVSNGFLWQSYDSLYLYGGEVSSAPRDLPVPYSLWAYDIKNAKWNKHSNPKTSAGNNSDGGNQPVQQAAEGAGVSIPEIGRGYYFAGHLDPFTTQGWALPVPRVYLKSLIEYTFPGYTNDGVETLRGGKLAGADGVWRNITQGGIQETAKFTNRADSSLVYVPGFGADGILVNLGGGTNQSFVRNSMRCDITSDIDTVTVANERHRCV